MAKIRVVDYLVDRLKELGITDVFGLPGDYNFDIVEAVEKNDDINWIGCTNELNAGYAADGYARIKGYGALVTTYGVGELSAINAIAGCYAESVPVVKIVGIPTTKNIQNNTILHHNFANPDYRTFEKAYSNVVEATAYLNEQNAKEEIDRVISVLINTKKPVYIAIPIDICSVYVENDPIIKLKKSDEDNLDLALEHITRLINESIKPVVVADVLIERFDAKKELKMFLENTQIPATTFLMGKGLLNWGYDRFIGTYIGKYDNKTTYDYVNSSDCVITIGAIYSDLNTFGFDVGFNPTDMIDIESDYTIVENVRYENVLMKDVLSALSEISYKDKQKLPYRDLSFRVPSCDCEETLVADYIYPELQEFLKEEDIIFSETGIIKFGFAPMKLPLGANLYNQVLWGSIGWATAAAFGAGIAAKDKRVILMTGEGAHQLTAQEVSSMMRYGLKPIIIILNNAGYTIERVLSKDPLDPFNDIAKWDYSKLPLVFDGDVWIGQAKTNYEFNEVLLNAEIQQKEKLCYIEIFTDKMDLPKLTRMIIDNKLVKKEANIK